jgi:hypothetical protein
MEEIQTEEKKTTEDEVQSAGWENSNIKKINLSKTINKWN